MTTAYKMAADGLLPLARHAAEPATPPAEPVSISHAMTYDYAPMITTAAKRHRQLSAIPCHSPPRGLRQTLMALMPRRAAEHELAFFRYLRRQAAALCIRLERLAASDIIAIAAPGAQAGPRSALRLRFTAPAAQRAAHVTGR